jgi:nitrogen fixation protein NifU and related proteins
MYVSTEQNAHNENLNSTKIPSSLASLYQEILVEHSKKPRHKVYSQPLSCVHCQEGKNPLCGDEIKLFIELKNTDDQFPPKFSVSFSGTGCSISQASCSMLCDKIQNVSYQEAKKICSYAEGIYSGKLQCPADENDFDDDVQALSGVAKFPVRVKCAALCWKTLEHACISLFDENGFLKHSQGEKTQNKKREHFRVVTE